ncbi:MAG: tyrosine-type recombinase/integrase [Bacilli bacterium]|nr:tyrosine-type recombinase/integrase [Bacilli bacterium]
MSFIDAYEEFKIYASKRHKKQGFVTIDQDFSKHVLPYFKNKKISELTKFDVLTWQNDILDNNYSNSFNSKLYYVFNSFVKYCVCCSYLSENVVSLVGPFRKKIEIKNHTIYTLKQFRKFRSKITNFVIKQFFNFMYFYGTRPSEAMALRFLDINFRYIYIRHSIERKGCRSLDTPKNQSSIRIIKINFLMFFRIWLLKQYYLKKYGSFSNDYFIFGGLKPLAPTTIDRYKKEAYIKANLPCITQHEFRHSYATRKIHSNVPIDVVSRSMGHSNVSTTLDIYLHQEKNTTNVFFS